MIADVMIDDPAPGEMLPFGAELMVRLPIQRTAAEGGVPCPAAALITTTGTVTGSQTDD